MSIISNLMALIEDERKCIEETGCLRGHAKRDQGFYYAPYDPCDEITRVYEINWEDVQISAATVVAAQKTVDEYLLSSMSSTAYLNEILAQYYSKPAVATQQVAYKSHRKLIEPGITISEYSY